MTASPRQPEVSRSHVMTALFIGLFALFAIRIWMQFELPLNHDLAANLYRAGELLNGAQLYVDTYAVHPPQIIWFCLPPVAVSQATGLPVKALFLVYFLVVSAICLMLCLKPLREFCEKTVPHLCAATSIGLLFVTLAFPAFSYGQKDHIVFVLLLPYLIRAIAGHRGDGKAGIASGALAALAIAIKPFYGVIWLGIEAVRCIQEKRLRRLLNGENIAFVVVLLANIAAVFILTPAYTAWAAQMLHVYGAFNLPLTDMLFSTKLLVPLAAIAAFLIMRASGWPARGNLILLASALLLYGAGLEQLKGWGYQFIPAAMLSGWYLLAACLRLLSRKSYLQMLVPPVLILVLTLSFADALMVMNESRTVYRLTNLVRQYAAGQPVYYPSELELQPVWPAIVEGGARWPVRFVNLIGLRHAYPTGSESFHPPASMPEEERGMFNAVRADLLRNPPRLLVLEVDHADPEFDYLGYFSQDSSLATLFSRYSLLEEIPNSSHASDAAAYRVLIRDPTERQ